jgi:uncharacterized membrane protein
MNEKKWMLLITFVSIIIFCIIIAYGLISAPHGMQAGRTDSKPPIPTYILSLASIFVIIAIIPLFYVLIHRGLERNFQETMNVMLKSINDNTNSESNPGLVNCSAIFFNFLNFQEKQVVKKLMEEKGNVLQSDISRMGNMGKVKTHRAVKDLERKGILKVEKYGNTNRIYLTEDIKKILKI